MMNPDDLLFLSQLLGSGLEQYDRQLLLRELDGGAGCYWPVEIDGRACGIWCSERVWLLALERYCGVTSADQLVPELLPCIAARLLQPLSIWGLQIETAPEARSLPAGIHTVYQDDELGCVLLDWPLSAFQERVGDWMPMSGSGPLVSLRLVAGWSLVEQHAQLRMQAGDALWLEGEVQPEQGEALLWWNRPLARVSLAGTHGVVVNEVLPDISFETAPVLAELGTIELPLASLSMLLDGEALSGTLHLNAVLQLSRDGQYFAAAGLLRSTDGLLARCRGESSGEPEPDDRQDCQEEPEPVDVAEYPEDDSPMSLDPEDDESDAALFDEPAPSGRDPLDIV
jgi:type III secretion protein Q